MATLRKCREIMDGLHSRALSNRSVWINISAIPGQLDSEASEANVPRNSASVQQHSYLAKRFLIRLGR
jgi:hypothetical protein